jgi:hypothetical protein
MQDTPALKLTFTGDGLRQGAVPITVVAAKLQALQQAMFHAAATVSDHKAERRGLWFNRFRPVAELTFVSAHHSDLVIEAQLAANRVLHPDFDIGRQAVDLLFDVAEAVGSDRLEDVRLNRNDRDYIMRALEGLMPNAGDQYSVKLENCEPARHRPVVFTAETKTRIKSQIIHEIEQLQFEEVTIVGELIKIYVDAGEDKITVRSQQRDIDCYYSVTLRDLVANLIAGSIVEATGFATLGEKDQVVKMHQLTNVEHVSMEPLRIGRFVHGDRTFRLSSPIAVNVEYVDGAWVYSQNELSLLGYGETREQALENLNADFSDVYLNIAQEDPANLDGIARQARDRLRSIVTASEGDGIGA